MPDAGPRRRTLLYSPRLYLTNPTGIMRYVIELGRALHAADSEFDITLYSGRTGQVAPDLGFPSAELRWPRRPTHLAWTFLHHPTIERAAGPADLVHLTSPYFPVPSKAPLVLTIHDVLPYQHPEWYPREQRLLFERAINYHLERAAALITPSERVADDVVEMFGIRRDRLTAIYEGVAGRFTSLPDDHAVTAAETRFGVAAHPYVVSLGAITPRKNLDVLFRALATLDRRSTQVPRLVVIGGDGPFADRTYEAASAIGVTDHVVFAGRLDDAEVHALLIGACALVHPSRYEGFGLTTIEAMAAGTPCIASRAGSLPEVVGDAGLLVDPEDAEGWAAAITQVVEDSGLRSRLRDAGRRHAAGFTWTAAAEQTLAVYRRAVAGR